MGKSVLQENYTVVTIPSGKKLLDALKKTKPALILLDVEMPEMSGYEVINEIKDNPETAGIPVIFLTGKAEQENELAGLTLGAVDYIAKPFSAQLLLKRIELHLLLQSQKNELQAFYEKLSVKVKERTNDINQLQDAIITWAAEMVEFRDEETGHHVERVQQYLKLLVDAMENHELYSAESSSWDIEAFIKSSSLHDVGKIKIKDDILLKNGPLNDEEYEKMKLHPFYGKILLESLQSKVPNQNFLDYARILSFRHHERWDGSGYPDGLKGNEIPLQARMMALADVYDALVSKRPYKEAFSHERAMQIILEGRGSHFDPDLTDLFISLSPELNKISSTRKNRG
jgi:putative two-component system response regulator